MIGNEGTEACVLNAADALKDGVLQKSPRKVCS